MPEDWSIQQARILVVRLEHLSVDSIWAHRASGLRGSILRFIEKYENNTSLDDPEKLNELLNMGFYILEKSILIRY